jgi:hypothetical protein
MPSKKMQRPCPKCGFKNPITHKFCGSCGSSLNLTMEQRLAPSQQHQDIAHPINQEFRDYLQKRILEAYQKEKEAAASRSTASSSSLDATTEAQS